MNQEQNRYKYFDNETDGLHLHTLDMQPLFGTSTVTKIISKSAPLMWWAVQMTLKPLGFIPPRKKEGTRYIANDPLMRLQEAKKGLERIRTLTTDEYLALLDTAYVNHNTVKEKAADDGTDLHAELERYVKLCIISNDIIYKDIDSETGLDNLIPKIKPFIEWSMKNVKRFLWSELHMYSEVLWTGGISDVGYEKHDGTIGILDFKSSKDAYTDQFIQVAGYDFQVSENGGFDAEGNKIFDLNGRTVTEYAVLPFGMYEPRVLERKDVEALREGFKACLVLHKLMNA